MSISRRSEEKLRRILRLWSQAIRTESAEHGRPNSFGVRELAGEYGLDPRDGYRIGATRRSDLWQWLGGHDGWGSAVVYENGRFYV